MRLPKYYFIFCSVFCTSALDIIPGHYISRVEQGQYQGKGKTTRFAGPYSGVANFVKVWVMRVDWNSDCGFQCTRTRQYFMKCFWELYTPTAATFMNQKNSFPDKFYQQTIDWLYYDTDENQLQ